MKPMHLHEYYEFAVQTAYLAGRLTLGYYQTGIQPDFKQDNSPVTAADRASEQLIRGRIEARYPGHAIVGEEYGAKEPSVEPKVEPRAEPKGRLSAGSSTPSTGRSPSSTAFPYTPSCSAWRSRGVPCWEPPTSPPAYCPGSAAYDVLIAGALVVQFGVVFELIYRNHPYRLTILSYSDIIPL